MIQASQPRSHEPRTDRVQKAKSIEEGLLGKDIAQWAWLLRRRTASVQAVVSIDDSHYIPFIIKASKNAPKFDPQIFSCRFDIAMLKAVLSLSLFPAQNDARNTTTVGRSRTETLFRFSTRPKKGLRGSR